jgi:prepilin-type N-terminal cleavage/methylation domain-containing protein
MSPLKTRGFTLIEILVALVLMGIVSVAIYQTLVTHQRTFLAQTQRIDLQQNIRAAATILPGEFRTLDAADSDIAATSHSLSEGSRTSGPPAGLSTTIRCSSITRAT